MAVLKFYRVVALAVTLYIAVTGAAQAGTVFEETFDSGSANFTTSGPYWTDQAEQTNGYIIQSTNSMLQSGWHSSPAIVGNDVSGTGYFLFEGTERENPDAAGDGFYISPTFPVIPDKLYAIGFFLTNADSVHPAQVRPEIGGSLLGAPVSAASFFLAGAQWQQFSFLWYSGSNTSASLTLHDVMLDGAGNDFGIDNISVSEQAPEPGTVALVGLGLAAAVLLRKRKATRSATLDGQ